LTWKHNLGAAVKFVKANRAYENWLREQTKPVESDLAFKHKQMRKDAFGFLRATFFRFVQTWPSRFEMLNTAPEVPSVGDAHLENFGTWRNGDGELIWGINDFDEAARFAYPLDLVRLAASTLIAAQHGHLQLAPETACAEILMGYTASLESGGGPFKLKEYPWLQAHAKRAMKSAASFTADLSSNLASPERDVASGALRMLRQTFVDLEPTEVSQRFKGGLGSLGRTRYVVLRKATQQQSIRVYEVKYLVPSAGSWVSLAPKQPSRQTIIKRAVREQDPMLRVQGHWLGRRLGPDAVRIGMDGIAEEKDQRQLLHAMGFETANVHLGDTKSCQGVISHLKNQKSGWLMDAADLAVQQVMKDFAEWTSTTE
jgi:uncharacterized protein (DUF2252 family)